MLKMEMTRDITKQILKNEQTCKKIFWERQLQMATFFFFFGAKLPKSKDAYGPSFSMSGNM